MDFNVKDQIIFMDLAFMVVSYRDTFDVIFCKSVEPINTYLVYLNNYKCISNRKLTQNERIGFDKIISYYQIIHIIKLYAISLYVSMYNVLYNIFIHERR